MIVIPKPSSEELSMLNFIFENDHVRDACRIFKKMIKTKEDENLSLLDLGCRDDKLASFFINLNYDWYGLDAEPKSQKVIKGSMEDIPFGSEMFHAIFCCHSLEHSKNIFQALLEMKRVLRLNGVIFIATPYPNEYQMFYCDKTHILVPTQEQMKRLLQLIGVEVVHCEYYNVEGQNVDLASLITIGRVIN